MDANAPHENSGNAARTREQLTVAWRSGLSPRLHPRYLLYLEYIISGTLHAEEDKDLANRRLDEINESSRGGELNYDDTHTARKARAAIDAYNSVDNFKEPTGYRSIDMKCKFEQVLLSEAASDADMDNELAVLIAIDTAKNLAQDIINVESPNL